MSFKASFSKALKRNLYDLLKSFVKKKSRFSTKCQPHNTSQLVEHSQTNSRALTAPKSLPAFSNIPNAIFNLIRSCVTNC